MRQPRRGPSEQHRCKQTRGVPSPRRIAVFIHVRFVHAARGDRIRSTRGAEPAGGRMSESGGQNFASRTQYKGALSAKLAVSLGRSRSCVEVWSLEPAVGGEAKESGGDGSRERSEPAVPRRAAFSCVGRGRAGVSSPASAKRSEVIGIRHSSSIAEGRTGS